MRKYKIWLEIEEISNVGESDEDYKDVSPLPYCLGEFESYEEADECAKRIVEVYGNGRREGDRRETS